MGTGVNMQLMQQVLLALFLQMNFCCTIYVLNLVFKKIEVSEDKHVIMIFMKYETLLISLS
jgi:hypothetical protein